MVSKREARAIKSRQKKKKRRESARATRGSRKKAPTGTGLGASISWPVGDCFVSQNWYEQGPRVHAVFSRRHSDGRVAAAIFEVDLGWEGVVDVTTFTNISDAILTGEIGRRSDELAIATADPELIVKVIKTGLDFGRENGVKQADGVDKAMRLFGEVSGEGCDLDVHTGDEPTEESAVKKATGFLAGIKTKLGL